MHRVAVSAGPKAGEAVRLLLAHGADAGARDASGRTPPDYLPAPAPPPARALQ